jgi:hypothetical protein
VLVPRFCAASLLASAVMLPATANAQDPAAAVALFQNGLAAMEAGRYEEGCPALEESYRLEPLPGVLFTSAECHAKWGKVATAVARYRDYLTVFERLAPSQVQKQRDRNQVAQRQIALLTPRVPQLTLVLPASAPPLVQVTRDGVVLGRPALGVALPVDPGEHVLVTTVSGTSHEQRVTVAESESKRVVLEIPQQTRATPAREPAPAAPLHTPAPARGGTPPWFWVAGGIGAAGLVTGGITGALVFSKKSEIDDNCRRFDCNREGKQAADSAQTLALVSTVGFAVGVAGCATAAVLLLTSPKQERAAARRIDVNVAASDSSALLGLTQRF